MRLRTDGDGVAGWSPGELDRADILCGLGLILSGVYSLAFTPAIPSLLSTHPVLLELLTGSTPAVVTAGAFARVGDVSIFVAILAAVPGVMMFDPFYWWAGKRWGRGAVHMVARGPRAERTLHRVERWTKRFGWLAVVLGYYLPVPNGLVYAAAGWTGMRLRTFLLLDLLGALLWIGGLVGLGYALGQSAVDVARAISRYGIVAALAITTAIVVWQVWRNRRAAPRTS